MCKTKDPQKFKNYLNAMQGGTVRLDIYNTPKVIEGLCTDGIFACVALVVTNSKNTRMSLTHTDLAFDVSAIIGECQWAGQSGEVHIIPGYYYRSSKFRTKSTIESITLPRIQKALLDSKINFKIIYNKYTEYPGSVAIDRNRKLYFLQPRVVLPPGLIDFHRIGQLGQNSELRHSINMLNGYALMFKRAYHKWDLQHNGEYWVTELPQMNKLATQLLDDYKTNKLHPKILQAYPDLLSYLKSVSLLAVDSEGCVQTKIYELKP